MSGEYVQVSGRMIYHLLHPRPAVLVISMGSDCRPGGMVAAWTVSLSHSPPLVGVAIAPQRNTYRLIKESGQFTLNVFGIDLLDKIHLLGSISGRARDKFAEVGLRLEPSRTVRPPHASDALGVLECELERIIDVGGDHDLFVGRVVDAYAKKGFFKGVYDPAKAKIILHLGKRIYTTLAEVMIVKEHDAR